jgi:hypothetical protein
MIFTTKNTKDTKVGFRHRISQGVIARRPQADMAIQDLEIAKAATQPRNDSFVAGRTGGEPDVVSAE